MSLVQFSTRLPNMAVPSGSKRQYLLVDGRCRRYSAPVDLRAGLSRSCSGLCLSEESEDESRRSKMSVIDLSVLFEGASGSETSLEFDTSISRDVSPAVKTFPSVPTECYDCARNQEETPLLPIFCRRSVWKVVLLSQLMSICLSVQDSSIDRIILYSGDTLLVNAQNLPNYILLALVWTPQLVRREGGRNFCKVLQLSGLRYVLLAVLHVEVDSLILSSLKHESYIGNQMIDCVAASLAFMVAYVCLDIQFETTHVVGFAVAFTGAVGMCAVIMSQSNEDDDITWGDILRFGTGLFVSFNSLAEELIVKSIDTVEYLGMIGLMGSCVCVIQFVAFERSMVLPTGPQFWCPQIALTIVQFVVYCSAPTILRDVGATGFHLGLMSSTFYSSILYYFAGESLFQQLILCPWILVIAGNYIFTLKRTSIQKHYFFPVRVTIPRQDS